MSADTLHDDAASSFTEEEEKEEELELDHGPVTQPMSFVDALTQFPELLQIGIVDRSIEFDNDMTGENYQHFAVDPSTSKFTADHEAYFEKNTSLRNTLVIFECDVSNGGENQEIALGAVL